MLQELLALELDTIKDGLISCPSEEVKFLQGQASFIVKLQQEINNPPKSVNELRGIAQ